MKTYNIYCDESCHLENDKQPAMVLGALWCPTEKVQQIVRTIRQMKENYGLKREFEIKWTKVSPGQLDFYIELVSLFFSEEDLHFRALVIPDKSKLNHSSFNQDHDTWYYKCYFMLLKAIFDPHERYRIYVDIKDTRSAQKIDKLHEVVCNSIYDFHRQIIQRIQTVRSHESELLQLSDLLIGAVSYVNRGLGDSSAKLALIEEIKRRSGYNLTRSTLLRENKFNIFIWQASEVM